MTSPIDPNAPDLLSPQAVAVLKFDADNAYRQLVPKKRGDDEVAAMLRNLTPANLLENGNVHPLLDVAIGAMWLWHDFVDEAHKISQDIDSAEGSWLHAIVHRREGDFSNSKYWYARCASLTNPGDLVDVVAAVHDRPDDPRYATAVALQRTEWRALFKHCIRAGA
ncbi:MAG: hypothetical protein H7Z14_08875 [Anaerolineae bacterium]|nr:hypothetical protein [Phycisphaerae bacterium]